jgi:hypothetical protein
MEFYHHCIKLSAGFCKRRYTGQGSLFFNQLQLLIKCWTEPAIDGKWLYKYCIDTPYLIAANLTAFSFQFLNDPAGTITAPGYFEYLLDFAFQLCFTRPVIIQLLAQIIIKAAPAHPHNRTQDGYGKGLHLLPDKIESHFDSLAKKAAAYFKISRSIKRRLFSFLSLLSSSSISLTDPEFWVGFSVWLRYCRTHLEI